MRTLTILLAIEVMLLSMATACDDSQTDQIQNILDEVKEGSDEKTDTTDEQTDTLSESADTTDEQTDTADEQTDNSDEPADATEEEIPTDNTVKVPQISKSFQSECLSKQGETFEVQSDTIYIETTLDSIEIVDEEAEFNCCLEAFMNVEINEVTNEITVLEEESEDRSNGCWCTCPFELSVQVSNLPSGQYTVNVYKVNLDEEILVHEEQVTID